MTRGPRMFALAVLAVACACGKSKSSPPPAPTPTTTTAPAPSEKAAPEKAAPMTEPNPAGAWRSSIADAPMQLTASANGGLTVAWTFTTDSDNEITGVLAEQADHAWRGTVHLKAGEEASDVAMTVRFDGKAQALHLELPAMFSDTIAFERAGARKPAGTPSLDCVADALPVLAATYAYKKLDASAPHLRTLPESAAGADRKCDLRVFVEDPSGETRTLGRFRVDFAARQVLQYNPAEDNYTPLANTGALFDATPAPPAAHSPPP